MDKLSINTDKCKGCGLCEAECGFNNAITVNNGKAAYNNNGSCIECLHCFKACPNKAISYNGNGSAQPGIFSSGEQISPVLTRRSCRKYRQEIPDRDLLTAVINEANAAPRFDISFNERKFIVLDNKEKINAVRAAVLKEIDKVGKIFSILVKNPFLSKAKKSEYSSLINLFKNILEKNKNSDSLFHGAPVLVMVTGQKKKSTSKENSLYAMSQFLIAAEEKGIGTCINGFVSFFSKTVQKYLEIDKEYSIDCAAVAGYPAGHFTRHIVRSDTSINWNMSSRVPDQKITA